jgi:hypothetical protein
MKNYFFSSGLFVLFCLRSENVFAARAQQHGGDVRRRIRQSGNTSHTL